MKSVRTGAEQFIGKARQKQGNQYDYSCVKYTNNHTKITIICKKHGEFTQTPNNHLSGYGCPSCGHEKSSISQRETRECCIEKFKKVHGNTYDYSKVEYINSATKVTLICRKHGEFFQTPNKHLSGCGCSFCNKEVKRAKTTKLFIEKAKQKYGDRYDYSKVNYLHSNFKIVIICSEHGEFQQIPAHHLRGSGCPLCSCKNHKGCKKALLSYRSTREYVLEKFKKVHGDRYDYSKVNYKNNKTLVEIVCKVHGSFMQGPDMHHRGRHCPRCVEASLDRGLKTTQEFIADAQKIHGDRYTYEKTVYKGVRQNVIVTCKKHGDFKVRPDGHLEGRNCSRCAGWGRSMACDEWLDSLNIKTREHWIPNTSYRVDGYDPATNTVYEYCGAFWHGHPKYHPSTDINPISRCSFGELFQDTIERFKTLKSLGYNLRVKWENPRSGRRPATVQKG